MYMQREYVTRSARPRSVGGFDTGAWMMGSLDVVSRGPVVTDRMQATTTTSPSRVRKRKAESQDNERLSKRLSLLNLERNGHKLYVPVEQTLQSSPPLAKAPTHNPADDDSMQLDDTKHKVYIYDLDAEISDSESDDGRLVFLPDIERHLRESRIPPSILANSDGELAGNNQLVLYNVPRSLTVPEEQDSVRKAIIETRARARAKQGLVEDLNSFDGQSTGTAMQNNQEPLGWYNNGAVEGNGTLPFIAQKSWNSVPTQVDMAGTVDYDPDAMDLG